MNHALTLWSGTIWQVRHQGTHTVRWSHTGTTNDTCATCTTTLMLGTGTMKHGVPTRTTAFTVVRGWVLGKSRYVCPRDAAVNGVQQGTSRDQQRKYYGGNNQMKDSNETTASDNTANTDNKQNCFHVRVDADVRDAINKIVKDRGLKTQKEAIDLAIQALNFGTAVDIMPEKEQAITEITTLFSRIVAKVTDLFYVVNDAKATYEEKADELRSDYAQEISRLKAENEELKQKVGTFKQVFAMIGQQKSFEMIPSVVDNLEGEDSPEQKAIPPNQKDSETDA